jgi:hypothetical protein
MTKPETRGTETLASVHLVLPSRGVAKPLFSAILAQYLRRSRSTTIAGPASNDVFRVEALSRALRARQRGDCVAPKDGQVLENQHDSHNTQSHKGSLAGASRERQADDRGIKTACKAPVLGESSKRKPTPARTHDEFHGAQSGLTIT